jgi:hypothetical protein
MRFKIGQIPEFSESFLPIVMCQKSGFLLVFTHPGTFSLAFYRSSVHFFIKNGHIPGPTGG